MLVLWYFGPEKSSLGATNSVQNLLKSNTNCLFIIYVDSNAHGPLRRQARHRNCLKEGIFLLILMVPNALDLSPRPKHTFLLVALWLESCGNPRYLSIFKKIHPSVCTYSLSNSLPAAVYSSGKCPVW